MNCPLFKNSTRHCIEKFSEIVSIGTFEYCTTDGHKMCPFYRIIVEKSPYCEFINECGLSFLEYFSYARMIEMYELNPQSFLDYCLSEGKKMNCALYECKKEEKDCPKGLLPDGRKIELDDLTKYSY